jgi:hypothetical protein
MAQPEKSEDFDEECDCEVCEAERAEDSLEAGQLAIDRVSDTEWHICDFQETDHPLTYVLFCNKINRNSYDNLNFTLVECDSDNFNNEFEEYQVYLREIWSADMYVGEDRFIDKTAESICELLHSVKISNPIELAYFFGGKVHHRRVNMPPVPYSN